MSELNDELYDEEQYMQKSYEIMHRHRVGGMIMKIVLFIIVLVLYYLVMKGG